MTKNPAPDIVVLSTADWDNPFWTNKQHVTLELAKRGHKVLYVESVGLRRPSLNKKDFGRILKRLWRGIRPPRRVHKNVWVWSPLVLPAHGSPIIRRINSFSFNFFMQTWLLFTGIKKQILWTYSPITTSLIRIDSFNKTVYHAVDDVKTQPGISRQIVEIEEDKLIHESDFVFVTSKTLLEMHKNKSKNIHYFSNVADYIHFAKSRDDHVSVPEDLAQIASPRIGFVGAISSYKIDFELLRTLARARPNYSIVLIGEIGEGDPETTIDSIGNIPNIHFLGPRSYSDLPAYLKGFDVTILPNRLNEYTRSMFPMKFFEFLSAGKTVVSVDLPSLVDHKDVAIFADSYEDFINGIDSALDGRGPSEEDITKRASLFTYETRTESMLKIINNET